MTFDNPRNQTTAVGDFPPKEDEEERGAAYAVSALTQPFYTHSLYQAWMPRPSLTLPRNKNFC